MTLGWEHNILKYADGIHDYVSSQQRVRQYLESTLVKRSDVYGDFLSPLDSANMPKWRVGGPSLMGIFFAHKEPGADGNPRLRIILDTRDINGFFRPPPSTRFPSAAAFSSLGTDHVDRIYFSGGDIADCFYVSHGRARGTCRLVQPAAYPRAAPASGSASSGPLPARRLARSLP